MNRREFIGRLGLVTAGVLAAGAGKSATASIEKKLNVLLVTADDMGRHSVGCFDGKPAGLTPNLDKFAQEGMRYFKGHVSVAICQPSRTVLGTGLYPHHSGGMGFMNAKPGTPSVVGIFQKAGYLAGVLGKVGHSTPCKADEWDYSFDQKELGNGRSPTLYYQHCRAFFDRCRKEGKPFYFMVNSHDPHRPYQYEGRLTGDAEKPSRMYKPPEVNVPGFVPDLPGVRNELAAYQNSTRRFDDTFGKVMQALEESGYADNTLVMFLSDNGIAIPFAKCNCYLASTRTPWMVRWPGVIKPGLADNEHFISGIDYLPTILEAAGIDTGVRFDGRSFVSLLKGGKQAGRDMVFTQIDRQSSGEAVVMRCVQDAGFGYIFTPWSDGKYEYHNANEGETWKAMVEAGKSNPAIAERVKMFRYRVPEEFYNLKNDPDCLNNLIGNPAHKSDLEKYRGLMHQWMKDTKDPMFEAFEARGDAAKRTEIIHKVYGGNKAGKKRSGKNATDNEE